MQVKFIDVGLKKYLEVLQLQENYFNKNIEAKSNKKPTQNYLMFCEHEPVFTLGKSGKRENILVSNEKINAEFYQVNRGGDITFHGPGQIVVYPIFDLDVMQLGLAQYIYLLEETIIDSLKHYGLTGERIEGAAGIWLIDKEGNFGVKEKKIGAIGVKTSRNITMHGIAVNINTNLTYFKKIRACGLEGKETTSLQNEIEREIDIETYKANLLASFKKIFNLEIE